MSLKSLVDWVVNFMLRNLFSINFHHDTEPIHILINYAFELM